ncbi:hypothetical protein BH24ACT4_BH24ACT4_20720 [soil metagenome]
MAPAGRMNTASRDDWYTFSFTNRRENGGAG